jgi:hypothetical protein
MLFVATQTVSCPNIKITTRRGLIPMSISASHPENIDKMLVRGSLYWYLIRNDDSPHALEDPYMIVPCFRPWIYPHSFNSYELPIIFQNIRYPRSILNIASASRASMTIAERDEHMCRISGSTWGLVECHIIPTEESE